MKKFLKWTFIVLSLAILGFATAVAMKQNTVYDAPYPDLKASKDTAIIERGKNLVFGPVHCAHCHASFDNIDAIEKGEVVPLVGGHEFKLPIGKLYSRNLTSDMETGIGKLTDGEIARALRYGVGADGHALLPLMPFQHMSDQDVVAILSYLRSTQPIKNEVPKTEYNMLGKIIKAFVLKPEGPTEPIKASMEEAPTVEYGEYLANNLANCRGCHTARDLRTGEFIGPFYAGGLTIESEFEAGTMLTTPNITIDEETGKIAHWDLDKFKQRFRQGKLIPASIMPWGPFSRMSDVQLEALFRYLQTVPAVKNDPGPVLSKK